MKVKIAYLPGEEREAEILRRFAKSLLKPAKVNISDRHAPYRHIYIATENQPKISCNNEQTVV